MQKAAASSDATQTAGVHFFLLHSLNVIEGELFDLLLLMCSGCKCLLFVASLITMSTVELLCIAIIMSDMH